MKIKIRKIDDNKIRTIDYYGKQTDIFSKKDLKRVLKDKLGSTRIVAVYFDQDDNLVIRYVDTVANPFYRMEDVIAIGNDLLGDEEFMSWVLEAIEKFGQYEHDDFSRIQDLLFEHSQQERIDEYSSKLVKTYLEEKRTPLPSVYSYFDVYRSLKRLDNFFCRHLSVKDKFISIGLNLLSIFLLGYVLIGGCVNTDFIHAQNRIIRYCLMILGSIVSCKMEKEFFKNRVNDVQGKMTEDYLCEIKSAMKDYEKIKSEGISRAIENAVDYMKKNPCRDYSEEIESIKRLGVEFNSVAFVSDRDTLERRVNILYDLVDIERSLYCDEGGLGLKESVDPVFSLDMIYGSLAFLGFDMDECNIDEHIFSLINCFSEIICYPFKGCEDNLLGIKEATIYYVHALKIGNPGTIEEAKRRGNNAIEMAHQDRDLCRRYSLLTESSNNLKRLYPNEKEGISMGKEMSLEPVKSATN